MSQRKVIIKLQPISKRFSAKGGFNAKVQDRDMLSYDQVLEEVVRAHYLSISPNTLKMFINATLDTMIENTLRDGKGRRLGDYFTLQLEVKGRFEDQNEQFDPQKHHLALKLKPLKALRRKPPFRDGITAFNRNAGPKVALEALRSASTPDSPNLVFGEDLVITGQNLSLLFGDTISIAYCHQNGMPRTSFDYWEGTEGVTVSPTELRISWEKIIRPILPAPTAEPPPVAMQVAIRSRGGEEAAKPQLHRVRAMFGTWLEKYPDATPQEIQW